MTTLKMAIDALNGDSGRWHEVSGSLKGAATAAEGLDVYSFSFPAMADVDLYPVYCKLQNKVADLLSGGSTETQDVADELIHVRKILEGSDAAAQQALTELWDYS